MEIYSKETLYQRGGTRVTDLDQPLIEDEENDKIKFKPTEYYILEDEEKKNKTKLDKSDFYLITIFTILTIITRFHHITVGAKPIWDEIHFGKFATYYLNRQFYHDVHPPLAKLLIALSGYLFGYKGDYDFESKDGYYDGMPYHWMRAFCATFGIGIVPLGYVLLRKIGSDKFIASFTAFMLTFDNGLIVISKFILLDPYLLFFTILSAFFLTLFHSNQDKPFSKAWWYSLLSLGVSLGLNNSIKWGVPLFWMIVVGLYTISDLWNKFKQLNISMVKKEYAKHWISRIFALLIIPMIIYMFLFDIHFKTFLNPFEEMYIMDSVYLARLPGYNLTDISLKVAHNSNITLRACKLEGRLLFSLDENYTTSNENLVTGYKLYDERVYWTLIKENHDNNNNQVDIIKDGDIFKLYHQTSNQYLRMNSKYNANMTGDKAYQMSAIKLIENDLSFNWKVKIMDDKQLSHKPKEPNAITTRFKLINMENECLLGNPDKGLPGKSGFHQEVLCFKDKDYDHIDTYWNFEFSKHDLIPRIDNSYFKRRFFFDVFRIHHAMWSLNNLLLPDPDKYEPIESKAKDWPLLFKGIRMCSWNDEDMKFFMIGNPIVWWISSFGILCYPILYIYYLIRFKRGIVEFTKKEWNQFNFIGQILFLGWFMHYIPFYFIGRILYLHHYFPPLMFAILLTPYTLNLLLSRFNYRFKYFIFFILAIAILVMYFFLYPLTYGFDGPAKDIANRRILSSWLIYDE